MEPMINKQVTRAGMEINGEKRKERGWKEGREKVKNPADREK